LKKNIFANFIGKFWSVLSGFLFIPLYIEFLGFESYSIISFTLVISSLLSFMDSGLTATLSREFARKDQTSFEKMKVFKTLETCYFFIISFLIILLYFISDFISQNWISSLNNIPSDTLSLCIKIIGFEAGFQMLIRFYMGGMIGIEEQVKANYLQIGLGIIRNGLVVLVIYFLPSINIFFIWQLFSTFFFTFLLRSELLKYFYGKYIFKFKPIFEKDVFLKISKFAGGMLLISLVASLNTQMDKLVISKLLDINTLGYYSLAISLVTVLHILISPISIAIRPRFIALYSTNSRVEASELFQKVNTMSVILLFSFMGTFVIYGEKLLWIWTGDSLLSSRASIYLPQLAFAYVMVALTIVPFDIVIANGYTKLNNILGVFSLFITLPGYWFCGKLYGAFGASFVFCIVQTLITFIYLYKVNKMFLNINTYQLFFKKLFLPAIIAFLINFCFSFIPNEFIEGRFLTFVWIGVLTSLTLICSFILLVPYTEIRQMIKKIN
jgi:O-antigen/teichoic acid export membrane protein